MVRFRKTGFETAGVFFFGILFICFTRPAYSQIALDTWLVGQYDFNDSINDHSQLKNNLIGSNITFDRDRFCTPKAAVYLNGSQNLFQTQTNALNNQYYTFTFWLKSGNISSNYATLIDIGSDPGKNNGQRVVYYQGGLIMASSGTTANPTTAINSSNISIPVGNWVFIAVVRNRTNYFVYVDGNPMYSNALPGYPSSYYNQANPALFLGSDPDQTHFYSGYLDDFHIYNHDLDAATIKAIYGFGTEKQIQTSLNTICKNIPVGFYLDSTNATGITWDFGDPGSGALNSGDQFTVSHTYKLPGDYVVKALLNTPCSVHAPVSTVIRVAPCNPPCKLPDFIRISDSCLENSITFRTDADSSLKNIVWDFGDGSSYTSYIFPFEGVHQFTLPGTYSIKAEASDTCNESAEIYYKNLNINSCKPQPIPEIPNAFTPNGDGINDNWAIPGLAFFPKCTIKIFDRWGNSVFTASGGYSTPFDGLKNGTRLPIGTYYYFIQLKEGLKPLVGSVSILY